MPDSNQSREDVDSNVSNPEGRPLPAIPPHRPETNGEFSRRAQPLVYGELVILGYNGCLYQGERGRKRSKYVLYRRAFPNGIKKSRHYVVKAPQSSEAILDRERHSISYSLSRNQAMIVEYTPDGDTDLFQVGRSSESQIDFVVMDTVPGNKGPEEIKLTQSTISRYSCRILVERHGNHTARIYAAGFDTSRNIFLGERATKWQQSDGMDGLTTNGVLIMHPRGNFCEEDSRPGLWREVSVGGGVYTLRESRSSPSVGARVSEESNILQDGTLIDLCGATLLWRSAAGLARSPTHTSLEAMVEELNAGRPQCPVGLNTLVIPCKATLSLSEKQPYVYLNCGHVQGLHDWGQDRNGRTCPMCLKIGPIVKLCMGMEPAYYVDAGKPTFAFNPCGHMTSEKSVNYWSLVPIPQGSNGFQTTCPFCLTSLTSLNSEEKSFVRLIFQDHVD